MSRSLITSSSSDHVYINSTVYNNTDLPIEARYIEERVQNFVNKGNEYHLSIIRFQAPSNTIPIFRFQNGAYLITLKYNGNAYQQAVIYTSRNSYFTQFQPVFQYQHFLDMINTALSDAFTALDAGEGSVQPPTEAPYLVYDNQTQLISLFAQQDYDPITAGGPTVEIYFNFTLWNFFGNLENSFLSYNSANGEDVQLLVYDMKNNTPTSPSNYYEMPAEYPALYRWYELQSIVFVTNSLPIEAENISARNGDGANINLPILTDFQPQIIGDGLAQSNFLYEPQGEYRLANLLSNTPLRRLDYQLFYETKDGTLYPILIPPQESVSIKFMLRRKDYA